MMKTVWFAIAAIIAPSLAIMGVITATQSAMGQSGNGGGERLSSPMNVSVDNSVSRELTVSWDPVDGADGYNVTWNPANALGVSTARMNGVVYTIDSLEPASDYTVRVTALHGSDSSLDSEAVTITKTTRAVAYSLTFDNHAAGRPNARVIQTRNQPVVVAATIGTDSAAETTVNIRIAAGSDTDDLLGHAVPDPVTEAGVVYQTSGLKAPAGQQTIDDGSFDVRARDDSARSFEIHVTCVAPSGAALRGVLDVEVRNEDTDEVANGTITCAPPPEPPPPDDTVDLGDCYSVVGDPDEKRDDVMSHATNPEMGQHTIELLHDVDSVQIIVTSCLEGPVWIRFLDDDLNGGERPFHTDVDECESCEDAAGLYVTDLDSGQKLELMEVALSADDATDVQDGRALDYDQYDVVTRGDGTGMYLRGKPGTYYQGRFRVHNPCDWADFYMEVYGKNGKVRQLLDNAMFQETVTCVGAPSLRPTSLTVLTDSDIPGEATLTWDQYLEVDAHIVVVIEAATRTAVYSNLFEGSATRDAKIIGLQSGTEYHFVVVAMREFAGETQYEADLITQSITWPSGS